MELIVGVNTYVTLSEFNNFIESYFTESERTLFDELEDEDKKVLLYKSCIDMQKLPYRGSKKDNDQKLAFPRVNRFGYESDDEMVKLAQVINAISFIPKDEDNMDSQAYQLRKNGITNFKLGSFSISINNNLKSNNFISNSGSVEQILSDWLRGGYKIL